MGGHYSTVALHEMDANMGHSRSKITVLRACLIRRWKLDLLKNTENKPLWSTAVVSKPVARGHPPGWGVVALFLALHDLI
jgi:hypothetical protein